MTEFKKGSIKEIQNYVGLKIRERGFEDESVHERLLLLVEEVGELVTACRKATGMNVNQDKKEWNNLGEEVADVINMIFAVGIELGLDIEEEFIKKNMKIDERIYSRSNKVA